MFCCIKNEKQSQSPLSSSSLAQTFEWDGISKPTVMTGKLADWETEQNEQKEQHTQNNKEHQNQLRKFPFGWPEPNYKEKHNPIIQSSNGHGYVFSYDQILQNNIQLIPDVLNKETGHKSHSKLYASLPYKPNTEPLSTEVKPLTKYELNEMNFGIKQKGPMYYVSSSPSIIRNELMYTLGDHVESKPKIDESKMTHEEELKIRSHSMHGLSINTTAVNYMSGVVKVGKGPKFFNRGANACINAIVTRYDRFGNVQLMAMLRPMNADSDPGDYQMSAGCIFFGEELHFNGCTIPAKTSTPYLITSGNENIDAKTGSLKGHGLAYARAAIYTKLWHGSEYVPIIDTWNFDKILSGIVDDVSNTSQSWVETSYNVHHVTGYEDERELQMLENAKVNTSRINVGVGVWRSIDPEPNDSENVYSQCYLEQEKGEKVPEYKVFNVKHVGAARYYDPFAEFDLWHGEHSFVARMISEYVKFKYKFEGPVVGRNGSVSPFGKSSSKK